MLDPDPERAQRSERERVGDHQRARGILARLLERGGDGAGDRVVADPDCEHDGSHTRLSELLAGEAGEGARKAREELPPAAPELPPIVARPSGSVVNTTPYSFVIRGSTSVSMNVAYTSDTVSYSSPRWLPCASPPPLWTITATIGGTRFS